MFSVFKTMYLVTTCITLEPIFHTLVGSGLLQVVTKYI